MKAPPLGIGILVCANIARQFTTGAAVDVSA